MNLGRIVSSPDEGHCLDAIQLSRLEHHFLEWVEAAKGEKIRRSRERLRIIFLLIRYTGAKLSEVLSLDPFRDIDFSGPSVQYHGDAADSESQPRQVQISEALARQIQTMLGDMDRTDAEPTLFDMDPGFVRRKFYECTLACGFPKRLGGPEMIRKARAVELMQGGMPLPAVQMMLGHSTPNLTSAYVSFSEDEIRHVARLFMEKESMRKTSARNAFFGKIQDIQRGDIQTRVDLATIDGHLITAVITNDSVTRLGLTIGRLITAEVKAPWVILQRGDPEPACSAENRFKGVLIQMTKGRINTECVVRISDATELCAIVSTEKIQDLGTSEGDIFWALFNSFSVVLHVD